MFLRVGEHLSYYSRRLADVFVNYGRRDDFEEIGVECGGDGSGKERLPRSWWTVEQDALRGRYAYALEEFRIHEWQFDHLDYKELKVNTNKGFFRIRLRNYKLRVIL
jgi:hypothetical protein